MAVSEACGQAGGRVRRCQGELAGHGPRQAGDWVGGLANYQQLWRLAAPRRYAAQQPAAAPVSSCPTLPGRRTFRNTSCTA